MDASPGGPYGRPKKDKRLWPQWASFGCGFISGIIFLAIFLIFLALESCKGLGGIG